MSILDSWGGHPWSDSSRVPRSRSAARTAPTKPWAAGAIARGCPLSAAAAARRKTSRQVAVRAVTNRMSSTYFLFLERGVAKGFGPVRFGLSRFSERVKIRPSSERLVAGWRYNRAGCRYNRASFLWFGAVQ